MFIDRPVARARIREAFSVHPAVALTGPRQCGKTTLAREIAAHDPEGSTFFDLERAVDRRRLQTPEQALGRLVRSRRHRRDSARAHALRNASRACRSARQPGAVPGSRQRRPFPRSRDIGIPCRPRRSRRPVRLQSLGGGCGLVAHPLAPRWLSALVPRPARSRVCGMEAKLRADIPRARHSPARYHNPGGDPSPILDDAGPLPRPSVERGGVRPRSRVERRHGAEVSRHPRRRLHGAGAPTQVRERPKAPGPIAQGLPSRQRAPAHPPHAGDRRGAHRTPEGRCFLRGLRDRAACGVIRSGRGPASGGRTAVRSWTCSSRAADGVTASNASSPTLPERRARCGWPSTTSGWLVSSSCIPETRRIRSTTGSRCCR